MNIDPVIVPEDVRRAVKDGAAWMDENHPGWAMKIDLSKLDMNNCFDCVIGQAVGNYFDKIYQIEGVDEYEADDWSIEHGFNAEDGDNPAEFHELEAAWTDEVIQRLR